MRALTLAELILLNKLREREQMAGEIRDAMAGLRKARLKMVGDLVAEIGTVTAETEAVRVDGIDALKLPRAELAGHRDEIREIREEFAGLSNGPPQDPLPEAGDGSAKPSPISTPNTIPPGGR